jgi:CRP-like cAMP-binding protein
VAAAQNHLIERLPRGERLQLLALCRPVQLDLAEVLCEAGDPARYVYFPVDGFISLLTRGEGQGDGRASLEVGMVGREGMLGAQLALGVRRLPVQALVQGAGLAWRIGQRAFRSELERSVALQRDLNRYLYVLMAQLTTSAACLRFHGIAPRLARWLLMSQDRAHAERFRVTHEFLASMLGVRRVGVTQAAGLLQRRGLIAYHRGQVTVLDRTGLEAAACSCYAADLRIYDELLA